MEKYDFSIMISAFLNNDNCFLKQVNILIILLFFVGWSSQTILVILLNKASNSGFYSRVTIASSFIFLFFSDFFFPLLKLVFLQKMTDLLIFLMILITWLGVPWRTLSFF